MLVIRNFKFKQVVFTYLHLSCLCSLFSCFLLNTIDDHFEIVLVADCDHVSVRHVIVLDLDLETAFDVELVADLVAQCFKPGIRFDHDELDFISVNLNPDL